MAAHLARESDGRHARATLAAVLYCVATGLIRNGFGIMPENKFD